MLDLLRELRGILDRFSTMEVLGVHVDWFFHLVGAALIVLAARRFLAERRVMVLTVGLLVAKEIFDVFAKTRLEYIRPPTLDLALDMAAGLAGMALGLWIARTAARRRAAREASA